MPAWLADNSFSWSKLKKSITAVWKCNASTLEPHSATMRHQAKGKERGGGCLQCATSDWLSYRVYHVNLLQATEPERAHALEWSCKSAELPPQALSLLHSAPSSYSHSHATHGESDIFQGNNGHLLPSACPYVGSLLLASAIEAYVFGLWKSVTHTTAIQCAVHIVTPC